jgi:Animal haem peroxidase
MKLPKTKPDATLDPSDIKCPGYKNLNTAWWDGSQIYGSSEEVTAKLRTKHPDGKLALTERKAEAFLARDLDGNPLTGFFNNWWIGLEMLHTLFALEHNSLCDMLRKAFPDWTGYDHLGWLSSTEPVAEIFAEIKSSTRPGSSTAR